MTTEIGFDSLEDYLSAIKELSSAWRTPRGNLWYRGLEDERLRLVPSAVWQGIDLPTEESMVADFVVYYRSYYDREPAHALELYALMRHYGLPTRLMDWTMSALVSLFFALERPSGNDARPVVWAMDHVELNRITLDRPLSIVPRGGADQFTSQWLPTMLRPEGEGAIPEPVFAFKHPMSNQRINAQKGCFTFHGRDTRALDTVFRDAGSDRLARLVLSNPAHRRPILNELFDLGFREDDIYQDLTALSRRILREHTEADGTRS